MPSLVSSWQLRPRLLLQPQQAALAGLCPSNMESLDKSRLADELHSHTTAGRLANDAFLCLGSSERGPDARTDSPTSAEPDSQGEGPRPSQILCSNVAEAFALVEYTVDATDVTFSRMDSLRVEAPCSSVFCPAAHHTAQSRRKEFISDLVEMAGIAAPTALANLLEYLPVVTAMGVLGNLPGDQGKEGLDAMSLGRAFFNITAMGPVFGMVGALRTLCPQAVGAGRAELLGVYAWQAMAIILAISVPCCALQFFAADLLTFMGEARHVAELAQAYAVRLIPQFFGLGATITLQRVYQAHKMVWSNLFIMAAGCAVAPPLQILLVHNAGLGYTGAAWANSIFNCVPAILQACHLSCIGMGYILVPNVGEVFSLRQLRHYLDLALPAFLQVFFKWGATELVVFVSGALDPPEIALAASSMATNILTLMLMAWIGVMVSMSVMVGRSIGAGDLNGARRAARAGVVSSLGLGAAVSIGVYFCREAVVGVLTRDTELRSMAAKLLQIVSVIIVIDSFNNAIGGVLSGLGMQRLIATAQLVGYYLVGIPVGLVGALWLCNGRDDGVYALWLGNLLAMMTSVVIQCVALVWYPWHASVAAAAERLRSGPSGDKPEKSDVLLPGAATGKDAAEDGMEAGERQKLLSGG